MRTKVFAAARRPGARRVPHRPLRRGAAALAAPLRADHPLLAVGPRGRRPRSTSTPPAPRASRAATATRPSLGGSRRSLTLGFWSPRRVVVECAEGRAVAAPAPAAEARDERASPPPRSPSRSSPAATPSVTSAARRSPEAGAPREQWHHGVRGRDARRLGRRSTLASHVPVGRRGRREPGHRSRTASGRRSPASAARSRSCRRRCGSRPRCASPARVPASRAPARAMQDRARCRSPRSAGCPRRPRSCSATRSPASCAGGRASRS